MIYQVKHNIFLGIGAIPIEKYPSFLSDVFLTGNSVS